VGGGGCKGGGDKGGENGEGKRNGMAGARVAVEVRERREDGGRRMEKVSEKGQIGSGEIEVKWVMRKEKL